MITSTAYVPMGVRIVLADFGSSVEQASAAARHPSTLYGTPAAMAPEQLRGDPVSPATDVHGLGVVLYRLTTGHYPIESDDLPGHRSVVRLRGIAGTITRQKLDDPAGPDRLARIVRDLPESAAGAGHLWMWRTELANPAP